MNFEMSSQSIKLLSDIYAKRIIEQENGYAKCAGCGYPGNAFWSILPDPKLHNNCEDEWMRCNEASGL